MPDQSILRATSSHFELARAQAAAAAMSPPAFQTEMARSVAGINAAAETMRRQLSNASALRELKTALVHDWGAESGLKAQKLSADVMRESVRRQMKAMVGTFGGFNSVEDAKASFIKSATGLDTEALLGGWSSKNFLKDLAGPSMYDQLVEQAKRWQTPHEDLAKSLEQFNQPLDWLSAKHIIESVKQALSVPSLEQSSDEATVAEGEAAKEQEDAAVSDLVARIEAQPTLDEAVTQIVQAIERTKQPALQQFLLSILLPILIAVVGILAAPIADFHLKKKLEASSKQEATKDIQVAAREAVPDIRLLKEFRFVGAKRLQVMSTARAKGPVLGHLQFGQVVYVVEKDRDFTLVAWKSEDGKAELHGWVFSRYLERFK